MPLYDIVLAPQDAAPAIAATEAAVTVYPGFACRPIDEVKLATLAELLGVCSFDDAIEKLSDSVSGSDDGPWVSQIPASLLDRIGGLAPPELASTAAAWGASEEFVGDRVGPTEAAQFLEGLRALLEQARTQNACLFLVSSL